MRTKNYYLRRSIARIAFWTSISAGFVWLATASVKSWDNYDCQNKQVVAEHYDSLWSIADDNCTGSIDKAVYDLVKEYGNTIQVGQVIHLTDNS